MGVRRRHRIVATGAIAVTLVLASAAPPAPAGAQPSDDDDTTSTTSSSTTRPPAPTSTTGEAIAPPAAVLPIVDSPRSAPELAAVAVEGAQYDGALAAHAASLDDHRRAVADAEAVADDIGAAMGREDEATRRYDDAVSRLRELEATRGRVAEARIAAARRRDKAVVRIEEIRARLRDLAINEYINGGIGGAPEEQLDLGRANGLLARRVVIDSVQGDNRAELAATVRFRDEQDALVTALTAELSEIERRVGATTDDRDRAAADRDRAVGDQRRGVADLARANAAIDDRRDDVEVRRRDLADARMVSVVVGLDLPFVVLNAYKRAADALVAEKPSCGLRWTALAGIGRTESFHGTYNGGSVGPDGELTKPILGVALDGTGGNADLGGDRAQGPMQFITSTWARMGRDGNGDGTVDPQNYYDATLAAAHYLCRQGPGLDGDEGMRRGFFSYNQSGEYVELVLSRTKGYDRFRLPAVDAAVTAESRTPTVTVVPAPAGAAGTGGT
jgi:hypothetical protein